jgi:hypothetical protein
MALVTVQGSMLAETATAAAFARVNTLFGGRLMITSPYGAHRTQAQQGFLYDLYRTGRGETAAPPGSSNHEAGRAIDVNNWASFPSLRSVMLAHGFTRDTHEQWHYNHTGTASPASTTTAPLSTATEEDEEMAQRPQFWRKTSGPISNSLFLLVYDNGTAVELDGRTTSGMSQVLGIRNQYAQYFLSSVADGLGVPFNEVSLEPAVYDAIRAGVKVLTPDYAPLK